MVHHLLNLSLVLLQVFDFIAKAQGVPTCGVSTYLDNATNQCLCSGCRGDDREEDHPNTIRLAGIMNFPWAPDIFAVTVQLINEGLFWPGTLKEGEKLEYEFLDDGCDETGAVRAYWDLRTRHNNVPPHGIVGSRCSGASTSLARVSGLEGVPQLSPASNSAGLTDDIEFPFFSRLVAPNNENGEANALVAILDKLGWKRVTVLATDKVFANDVAKEFRKLWVGGDTNWTGVISDLETIRVKDDNEVDLDSVREALDGIPVDEPSVNSRIIFLAAHNRHAFQILQYANQIGFQPDTIWVGPSSWIGRSSPDTDFSWLPDTPGYLGVAPLRNRDIVYQRFLERLQDYERSNDKPSTNELPMFAAETVDSIVALTKAISDNGVDGRRDGQGIVRHLRQADFDGVSGLVQLTEVGDRKNPKYSILNAKHGGSGEVVWTEVGSAAINGEPVTFTGELCFTDFGCVSWQDVPSDTYPDPIPPLPRWAVFLIVFLPAFFGLLLLGALLKYWRSRKRKKEIFLELERIRKSVVGMRVAKHDYTPIAENQDGDIEESLSPVKASDIPKEQAGGKETAVWCWRESSHCMDTHSSNSIFGDPKERWIKYDASNNDALEAAYRQEQRSLSILPGYLVDFGKMKQTKITTGFVRDVQRQVVVIQASRGGQDEQRRKLVDLGVKIGDGLPDDLLGEPRMVLVKGDIVQISSKHQDGWAFGTKLYHADEARSRELLEIANGASCVFAGDDEATILTDSGWFQISAIRTPKAGDLSPLRNKVGDTTALDPPDTWDEVVNPTVAQKHELKEDDEERDAIERAFLATVCPPKFGNVRILKVERVQNLAMWQSYVVKRQTICYRETGQLAAGDEAQQRKALERFERRWLWHGSTAEAMDKILQQGLNRSFCGKHATFYGKGVYFARDAAYSANKLYAAPDHNGNQYMMACRVVVGEFCRGERDALTPDVRDSASHTLYDTTVDVVSKPSVYVTYHDAQAYPEYLITFRT